MEIDCRNEDIFFKDQIILDLYRNGIVKVNNLFDQRFIEEIISAKNHIFSIYPYGQNDNYEKILNEFTKTGDYPIKNPLDLNPIFKKIIENKKISYLAEQILGKDFYFTNISMRIIPKTNHILETHRDFSGGLSFSLLLDDISINEGETFFYKDSYKNPDPTFVDLNKFSSDIISTTGKIGDIFFWFPDSWHGRNHNLSSKKTCILMVDIENKNTGIYKINRKKKFNFLNEIFKYIGNSPNKLLTHLFYCILRFKVLKKKITSEKIIYTRLILKNNLSQNFSILKYLKMIKPFKYTKVVVIKITRLILGDKFFLKLKKIVK